MTGKIHDCLSAEIDGAENLLHLHVIILHITADTEIYINFRLQHTADAVRIKPLVRRIRWDNHLSFRYPVPDFLLRSSLFSCHSLHLRSDDPFSRRLHLRMILSHL